MEQRFAAVKEKVIDSVEPAAQHCQPWDK